MKARHTGEKSDMPLIVERNEFSIGGDLPVRRLGFGAMRLSGKGVWGPPENVPSAQAVLRRVVELGVNFIDTADVYGPGDNERLLRDTLQPYSQGLVIGTKGGMTRKGPATPENPGIRIDNSEVHLRRAVEGSLRDLGVERIDLYQLHRADSRIPIEDTMAVLLRLRDEGKIRHVGLSAVGIDVIARARSVINIATVQNEYNLTTRHHDDVLDYCKDNGIGFIPYYPQRIGPLAEITEMKEFAARKSATTAQIAIAWLLKRSPIIIAIPGTSSLAHLIENVRACEINLSAGDMDTLDHLAASVTSNAIRPS
jgi:pyridoxine 4-dehydrogenase